MFDDYVKLVVGDYERKRASQALSSRLVNPSPARLRDECLLVCKENFQRKDEGILRTFFNTTGDQDHYLDTIHNCVIDRFRPLVNFLRDHSIKTDAKNINLLAWLIDFKDRPFELGKDYEVELIADALIEPGTHETTNETQFGNSNQTSDVGINATPPKKEDQDEDSPVTTAASKPKSDSRNFITLIGIIVAVVIILSLGLYIYNNADKQETMKMGNSVPGGEGCMYWQEDHYTRIPCHQMITDALVIALDTVKLAHFKKITTPDTLTQKDAGRVWYTKTDGEIEFYTSDGFHPVDIKRRLKPATAYIIDKYIVSQKK